MWAIQSPTRTVALVTCRELKESASLEPEMFPIPRYGVEARKSELGPKAAHTGISPLE